MKTLRFLCILFTMALPFGGLNAQSLDSRGTDYWLAFMDTLIESSELELSFFLSSEVGTDVTIDIPSLEFSETISLEPNLAVRYEVPNSLETTVFDTVVNKGIQITSTEEISVYGLSRTLTITDAYLALPSDVIGNEYIVMAFGEGVTSQLRSEYLVLATQDGTRVTITPSVLDTSLVAPVEVTLNAGEVYQHRSGVGEDVTGTIISSDYPVSVFAGHQCANIPSPSFVACDHLIEQLMPNSAWGTRFVTSPLATRVGGDTFRILASEDDTTVSISGLDSFTINAAEFNELVLEQASLISSDKPILVAQFSNSSTFDDVIADPFMVLIPPFEQFLDAYIFATPTEGFSSNFVNIVTRTSDVGALALNGESVSAELFTTIDGTAFSYAQIELGFGSQSLSGALAGITVYGYDSYDSYGYPGGLSLSSVAELESLVLFENFELSEGEVCFSALVSDIDALPLEDIRVDFIVNIIEEGFGITDSDGVAEYCIQETGDTGEYNVTASVGGVSQALVVLAPEDNSDSASGGESGGGSVSKSLFVFLFVGLLLRRRYRKQD